MSSIHTRSACCRHGHCYLALLCRGTLRGKTAGFGRCEGLFRVKPDPACRCLPPAWRRLAMFVGPDAGTENFRANGQPGLDGPYGWPAPGEIGVGIATPQPNPPAPMHRHESEGWQCHRAEFVV